MSESVETYARKRLEVVVEQPNLGRVTELLDERGAVGYTVLPTLGGKGTRGVWTPDPSSPFGSRVVVIAVAPEAAVEGILAGLREVFREVHGVAFVSDAEMLARDR